MSTIAKLLGAVDSVVKPAKSKIVDMLMNPAAYAQQMVGLMGDQSRAATQNALLADEGSKLDAMGSVMGGLPQYKNARNALVSSLMGVAPVGVLNTAGMPDKGREFIRSKADELASTLNGKGFQASVEHSGSAMGPSSYVTVVDPLTGRYIKDPARFSNHAKGVFNSQFVHEMDDDPATLQAFIKLADDMRAQGPTERIAREQRIAAGNPANEEEAAIIRRIAKSQARQAKRATPQEPLENPPNL
jgi:hypothetical protein